MASYQGKVNGIDAQATKGLDPRCQAFINADAERYIQVTTSESTLQTVLELACIANADVEVTYDDSSGINVLSRVRELDR
jgi:hypothetical protein